MSGEYSNSGIVISAPHDTSIVRQNTLYATGQNGTGAIQVERSSSVDNVLIEQNVIVGWGVGIDCNLVNYMTVEHNLLYGNDENYGDCFFRPPDDLVDINPMWCDSAGGVFTLNLDSPCVASNNDYSVPIGALGVACAEGELTHGDVAITVDEMDPAGITVTSDVKVSSGNSLTVGPGVMFKVDDADEHNLGADPYKNEVIIHGTLNVEGTSGSMVSFSSSKLSPGESDWRGLYFYTNSSAFVDYVAVRNATYGTALSAPDTAAITHSLFESNGTFDIQIGGAGTDLSILIEGNTLNVGGGDGRRRAECC